MNARVNLFVLVLGLLLSLPAKSQSPCYEVLFDGAGLSVDRSSAVAAACAARDSMGHDSMQLGIYSAVYYPPSRFFAGGFPDSVAAALKLRAATQSPAHLLLLWSFDGQKALRSAGYQLVLPDGGCLAPIHKARLAVKIETILQQPLQPDQVIQREVAAIKALAEFFGKQRRCCAEGAVCDTCTGPNDIFSLFLPNTSAQYGGVDTLPRGTVPPRPALALRTSPNYSVVSFGPEAVRIQDRQINIQTALADFAALYPQNQFHLLVLERNLQVCLDDALNTWLAKEGAKGVLLLDSESGIVNVSFLDDRGTGAENFLEDLSGLKFVESEAYPEDISIAYGGNQNFYACLDYSGKPFVLPRAAIATFKRNAPNSGALLAFSIGQTIYHAASFPSGKFAGYYLKVYDRPLGQTPVRFQESMPITLFSLRVDTSKCQMYVLRKTGVIVNNYHADAVILQKLEDIQHGLGMEDYESALLASHKCATDADICRLYFQDHPYLKQGNTDPISRVVQANPCLLRVYEHYNFGTNVAPDYTDHLGRAFCLVFGAIASGAAILPELMNLGASILRPSAQLLLSEAELITPVTKKLIENNGNNFAVGFTTDIIFQSVIIASAQGVSHIKAEIDIPAAIGSGISNTIPLGATIAEEAARTTFEAAVNCIIHSHEENSEDFFEKCIEGAAVGVISRAISNIPQGAIVQLGKLTSEQFLKLADWIFSKTTLTDVQVKGLVKFVSAVSADLLEGVDRLYALGRSPHLKKAVSSLSGTLTPQAIDDIKSILLRQGDEFFGRLSRESGLAEAFVNDLKDEGLRAAMVAKPGLGRAWGVLRKLPISRTDIKTIESADRLMSKNLLNSMAGLLPEEVIAFHRYTVSSFSMNGNLNTGKPLSGFDAELRKLLRSGIAKLQNSSRRYVDRLFRGQSLPESLILEKYVLPFQKGQALGGPVYVTENAFLSTTKSRQIADDFIEKSLRRGNEDPSKCSVLFHIDSRSGVYIDDVSNYGINFCAANPICDAVQEEVVMIDGLTFRINDVKITDVGGYNFYQIFMEEL